MFLRIESLDGNRTVIVNTKTIELIYENRKDDPIPLVIGFVSGKDAEFHEDEYDVNAIIQTLHNALDIISLPEI